MNPSSTGNQRITFPRVVGILSGLLGLFVLVGWAYGIPWIKSVLSGSAEMKANTAVGLLLSLLATLAVATAGFVVLYSGVRRELTRRTNAEAALRHTEEQIRRLNADLQSRAAQIEAVNTELEAFSYSVSHDLRAPLRHIRGYVEMLTKATEGQLSGKAVRYLEVIGKASEEMGQLIDHLLAFSRMGRTEIQEGSVDLNQLVQQTLQGLETATRDRNIVWKIAALPPGTGDRTMLRQVFANLIGNAVKYSTPRDPAEIEIGCAGEENGRHLYFVRDNGAGFDMRYAHKLFGVFQRLHTAEEFEGTGIGLATVRRILTRHGDRIWAESAPDRGATFYFTLKPGVGIKPPTEPDNRA